MNDSRFSRWFSSSLGLGILAAVFAIGAVVDAVLGHRTPAIVSGVLVVALYARWRSRR
jgi:hypothetical protein